MSLTTSSQPGQTKVESENLDLVMLEGKVGVVLHSSQNAGRNAIDQLLRDGAAKVVLVADTEEEKEAMLNSFPTEKASGKLIGVLGSYKSRKDLQEVLKKVKTALGPDTKIDHIVSSIGYSSKSTTGGSEDDFELMQDVLANSLYPHMWAARTFLPEIQAYPGTSFTIFDDPFPRTLCVRAHPNPLLTQSRLGGGFSSLAPLS